MDFSPEVLIYVDKVKEFIAKNPQAEEFFLKNVSREEFFHNLAVVAQGNYENVGQPELTPQQFEGIRVTHMMSTIINLYYYEDNLIYSYKTNNFKFYYK